MKNKISLSKLFTLLSLLFIVFILSYLILNWNTIPDKIPAHYGANGIIDRWGNKSELWICPVVSVFMIILFTAIEKYVLNKQDKDYSVIQTMVSALKLMLTIMFGWITFNSIQLKPLPSQFNVIIIGTISVILIITLIASYYVNKKKH